MIFRAIRNRLTNNSDQQLLKEFQTSGDPELLGELYSRYMHLVYGVCLKYLKEREESRDAVMQIFEKLIIEIPHHRIENFSSWLHVVTKNYCLMHLRSKKSRDEKIRKWIESNDVFMENDPEMHPVDRDDAETDIALEDCIKRLKGEQRTCIVQFYFEKRCYSEIAANLGIDIGKVKSYLQNGKRNLKICLEEKNVRKG
jgi:RNA polymerase sigma-70 factor (ECF subfamily)